MSTLKLIRKDSGRVYRYTVDHGMVIVGSSRKSHLRLPKNNVQPIEGSFELGPQGWTYHSFSMTIDQNRIVTDLKKANEVEIGGTLFEVYEEAERNRFSNDSATTDGDLTHQVLLVYNGSKLLSSLTAKPDSKAEFVVLGNRHEIQTMRTSVWKISESQGLTIKQKSVSIAGLNELRPSPKDFMKMKTSDRWSAGLIMMVLFLGITSSLMNPTKQEVIAESEAPKISAPVTISLKPPKLKPMKEQSPAPTKVAETKPTSSLDRIRNLTAKISKTAGAFIDRAARAPSAIGPNGNLAAATGGVARLGGSKVDWNAMAGSKVSGQVGGTLSGGTGNGNLSAAGTGSGGVGLLEKEGEVGDGLDKEVIAAYIRKNIGHILYCYERSLSANPNLFGKVAVKFIIGASGQVETQRIGETTLKDAKVEGCILEKVSHWKFPEPKGGVQVAVTYPFMLKTTN